MTSPLNDDDDGYPEFLGAVRDTFHHMTQVGDARPPLFRTDEGTPGGMSLFDRFLSEIPSDKRQHYTCNNCRRFFTDYGSLVTVDENGYQHSVFWDEHAVPPFFQPAVWALRSHVERGRYVSGAFFYAKAEGDALGIPENVGSYRPETVAPSLSDGSVAAPSLVTTRTWHHLAVQVGQANVRTRPDWWARIQRPPAPQVRVLKAASEGGGEEGQS